MIQSRTRLPLFPTVGYEELPLFGSTPIELADVRRSSDLPATMKMFDELPTGNLAEVFEPESIEEHNLGFLLRISRFVEKNRTLKERLREALDQRKAQLAKMERAENARLLAS